MKILILSDGFPPAGGGGAEIIALRFSQGLIASGHEVKVFSTCQQPAAAGQTVVDGVEVIRHYCDYDLRWRGIVALKNKRCLKPLNNLLADYRPDIVHAHNVHAYISYASLKLAKKKGAKVFLTAHDVDAFHQDKFFSFIDQLNPSVPKTFNYRLGFWESLRQLKKTKNPLRNLMVRHYLSFVDKIFSVSEALKEALTQNGIKNTEVVYNGFAPMSLVKNARETVGVKYGLGVGTGIIFMAGRFGSLKGGNLLVPLIKALKERGNDFVMAVAAKKGGYSEKIMAQAEKEGLSHQLLFTGWLHEDALAEWYSACDICLVPSVCFDSFPNNNLEAMAYGKPVVGTCFGGTREAVVDGQTGFIVNPYDIEKMAEIISGILVDKNKARQLGAAGYQRWKDNFTLDKQVARTLEFYSNS